MTPRHGTRLTGLVLALSLCLAAGVMSSAGRAAAAGPVITSAGIAAAGRTISAPATLEVAGAPAGTAKVKWYLGTSYLGSVLSAPWAWTLTGAPGPKQVEARFYVGSSLAARAAADFVLGDAGAPTPTPTPTRLVRTVAELDAALTAARPGDVIDLADGTYAHSGGKRFRLAADGTAAAPITLRGSRAAVLTAGGPTGDYGLHITGDHWRVLGLAVRQASKGVVLDGSVGTVLDGIEVGQIGDEGVHFRACSSDGVLRGSLVHDTGLRAPRYGEGVYVGSANSNWAGYACQDGRDNSERVLITGNVFRTIAAEGADLKEGTDSGTLRQNVFDNTGFSGENSADSAVDAKGNGWLIVGNVVRNPTGAFLDAFQTHTVYAGYGTGNTFSANRVEGAITGFGFGLYPQRANVVRCDNTAPGAAGLVGVSGKAASCTSA